MKHLLAAASSTSPIELGPIGGSNGEGLGPFAKKLVSVSGESGAITAMGYITAIVSAIIGVMTVGAVIWFIFQFLVAGLGFITSGGDKSKLENARDRITNSFIGLVIVVAGWSILALVGQFFGYNTLVDPAETIKAITGSFVGGSN